MTDLDLTAARAAIVRVAELLERAESKGASAVYVSDVRGAIREQLDAALAAPARTPQPGDTVLGQHPALTAVREALADAYLDGIDLMVLRVSDARALIAAVNPSWWPPRPGDIVLDVRGDMWRWDHDGHEWQEIRGEYAHKMDRLAELFGPLDLIVRDGKRYDG